MMIKLDEAKLAAQQALWVVFSRGKIVVQESSESIPVAYLSDIPFLASYVDEIHQLPPLNETAHRDCPYTLLIWALSMLTNPVGNGYRLDSFFLPNTILPFPLLGEPGNTSTSCVLINFAGNVEPRLNA